MYIKRVVPKSYKREGQPRKTENELTNVGEDGRKSKETKERNLEKGNKNWSFRIRNPKRQNEPFYCYIKIGAKMYEVPAQIKECSFIVVVRAISYDNLGPFTILLLP